MLDALLSDNRPRSRILAGMLVSLLVLLLAYPFLFKGSLALSTAASICLFGVLAASYDMLLGYTAIISFAHVTFFGVGAYGVALALVARPGSWGALLLGLGGGVAAATLLALVVGLISLRVKALYFALVTLAVAGGFIALLMSHYEITGGETGLAFELPRALKVSREYVEGGLPGFDLISGRAYTVDINGKLLAYYGILTLCALLFLLMLRIVGSPFGRVLQAIRENEFRVRAIGYKPVVYRTLVFCVSCAIAAFVGGLYAVWVGFVDPEVAGAILMINVLIMTVLGGIASLYGSLLGATLLVFMGTYLRGAVEAAVGGTPDLRLPLIGNVLGELVGPDRWPLWMGLMFVLSVYFFTWGITGTLRIRAARKQMQKAAA